MSKVCRHHLPSECDCRRYTSEFIDNVKNHIEAECIQNYMSMEQTMTYLQDIHQIDPYITKTIWEHLNKDNPDFFKAYYLSCEILSQIKTFNSLLEQQVTLMIERGLFDLTIPPPEIMDLLRQDPELQTRILQNLANRPSISVANQPQHRNQLSTLNGFAYNNVGGPSIGASDFGVPSFAQPATTAQDLSTSQIRNHMRNTLQEMQYLPQLQSLEYGESSNVQQNGRSIYEHEEYSNGLQSGRSIYEHGECSNGLQIRRSIYEHGECSNGLQIGRCIYEHGESSNRLQSGRRTYEYGECSNGLQNGESTYGLHYVVSSNGLQNAESNNMLQYEGSINGLHGVTPHEQPYFQEQDSVTIQTPESINVLQNGGSTNEMRGEPLYRISESEASNNANGGDDTYNVSKPA